jgi:multisubunit Na+/H+ antiporter MnhE subunit
MVRERLRSWLAWTVALFVLWLALVGAVDSLELIAGAGAAAIGAFAAEAVRERGLLGYRFRARWLLRAWRPVYRIVPDFGVLMLALARALISRRRPTGAYQAIPFPAGGDDAESAGLRAFSAAVGSLAPNSVVIDIDSKRGRMLLHKLVPGSGPTKPL